MQLNRYEDKYPHKYKAACQHPYAFTRGALEETVRVLKVKAPESVPLVEQALCQVAVEKPSRYTGDQNTDYIYIRIDLLDVEIICDAFVDMEAASVSADGDTTALASHYARMADVWSGYLLWLEDDKDQCNDSHPSL